MEDFTFLHTVNIIVHVTLGSFALLLGIYILIVKKGTKKHDIVVALLSLCLGIYFAYYIKSFGFIWSPSIIYATVGALFVIVVYDLLRYLIPSCKYKNLWLYEHIYKMIGAFTALLGAATGTILSDYKPYSQFLPSVFGTLLAIGFIGYFYRKNRLRQNENPKKST